MSWVFFIAFLIGYLLGWRMEYRRVKKISEGMQVTIDEMQKIIEEVGRENQLAWKSVNSLTDKLYAVYERMGIK